ncbi:hypothetical protein L227DRAFT_575835 [Lentinus tigrinus ALCF2SS1-6]|uniref:DUF4246 domain-containing protein n=1 Tax=Lentinus tigrinus ALCF2SS1-6 TaxID=1328759 RepID=A0A5C2S7L3_9APHY|nr:hypothetical protein L227DRAFT_575835 [Lentinus tigrinus ALCF2SS1-6]
MTQVPETGIYATSVGNMYESRSLISLELRQNYIKSVSLLENVPDEEKDWHPDTNNRVLDLLVRPSMYCIRIGESYVCDA